MKLLRTLFFALLLLAGVPAAALAEELAGLPAGEDENFNSMPVQDEELAQMRGGKMAFGDLMTFGNFKVGFAYYATMTKVNAAHNIKEIQNVAFNTSVIQSNNSVNTFVNTTQIIDMAQEAAQAQGTPTPQPEPQVETAILPPETQIIASTTNLPTTMIVTNTLNNTNINIDQTFHMIVQGAFANVALAQMADRIAYANIMAAR